MASNASISGLVSGLDTATIISQLMQLEAAPQARLKTRVSTEQTEVRALQTLNTKTALLGSKAAALAKDTTWAAVTATSSNQSVTVTAAGTAQPAGFSVTVTSVASTYQRGYTDTAALTDRVTGATNTVMLGRSDGSSVPVVTTDGTLQGLVTAINDPANATGLHATAVNTGSGYRLLVESTATGAAQGFTLSPEDGSFLLGGNTARPGTDAALDLGAGITVSSTTNTFKDVVPGVTLTLAANTAVGATSSVEVKRNASALSSSVSDLVTALNDVLSEIDTDTAYDATTKVSGVLGGDALARSLRSSLFGTVFPTDGTSLATVGITTTRDGKLAFDATKFASAYAADPGGTMARFTTNATTNGFAARVEKAAKAASDSHDGTITGSITSRQSGITRLQDSITDWDQRLALRKETLSRQFTALETALGQMQGQASWLAGQISSLPSWSK